MRFWVVSFVTLAICLTRSIVCTADIDDVQLKLLKQFGQPLRWDNVTGCPEWVGGAKPYYSRSHCMSVVGLQPGHCVIVKVRPYELVRVFNLNGPITPGSLEMALSQGTNLYASAAPAISTDGRSAVVCTESPDPMLCRVAVPRTSPCGLEVAVFISRRDTLGEIAPYRKSICVPGATLSVQRNDKCGSEQFRPLVPNLPVQVNVSGPSRIAVESRLLEPMQDTRLHEYRIQALLNDMELATIEADTAPENTKVISFSGVSHVVGRLHRGFLEIPQGCHRLTLVSNAAIIVRLLAQESPDYAFPRMNQPSISAEQIRQNGFPSMLFRPSWTLSNGEIGHMGAFPFFSAAGDEKVADRLRRDNSRRQGGLMAADLMELAGKGRPDAPQVRDRAKEIEGYYTGFRNLMPSNKPRRDPQRYWWFVDRKLKKIDQPDLVAAERHTNSYLNLLSGGYFNSAPVLMASRKPRAAPGSHPAQALHYTIPKRFGPGVLGIAVGRSDAPHTFMVMLVGGPTHCFQVIPGASAKPADFRLNLGEAGLEMLRHQRPGLDSSTLGGPFSVRFAPAPLMETSTFQVPLPSHVTEVFVWAVGRAPCGPLVCLQYRDSNPYTMAECEYLEAEKLLMSDEKRFRRFVNLLRSRIDALAKPVSLGHGHLTLSTLAAKDLESFLLPLVRLIRSHHTTFETPVKESTKQIFANKRYSHDLGPSEIRNLEHQAEASVKAGQWLMALEKWGALYVGATGSVRDRAALQVAEMLERLGDSYLAEMLLRKLYLQPDGPISPELSREALKRLQATYSRNYTQTKDPTPLLTLACVEAFKNPGPVSIRELAVRLVEAGHYELALMAGMMLPHAQRPLEAVLRAARKMGWYTVYGQTVAQLTAHAKSGKWTGLALLDQGLFGDARATLASAGQEGLRYANALSTAMEIQQQLNSPGLADRIQGILRWERWQWHQPGPFQWNDEPGLIADYEGSVSIYSIPRDLYFKAFHAVSSRPLKIRVYGPVRVRIGARPLHPAQSQKPLDGWMYTKTGPELYITAITNNMPSQGLSIVGQGSRCPGQEVFAIHEFGPGLHEMEIHGGEIPLLVQVHTQRPEVPLGILPPLTPETVDAALRGPLVPVPAKQANRWECSKGSCLAVLPLCREGKPVYRREDLVRASAAGTRMFQVSDPSCWKALAETRKRARWWPGEQDDPIKKQARALARGDLQDAAELSTDRTELETLNHMSILVYWGERTPKKLAQVEARAQKLFTTHPDVPLMRALLTRLSRKTSWEPLTLLDAAAGLRIVPIHGWKPESDAMRMRKAITEPLQPGEQVVVGKDKLVLVMENLRPVEVTAHLALADVPFLPPVPMEASFQLDGGRLGCVTLSNKKPSKDFTVRVPEGRHRLQVGVVARYANQFVRVKFCETRSGRECVNVVLTKEDKRTYYLATAQDPLKAKIHGPAWIRIDELRNDDTRVNYRFFPEGWHDLVLKPERERKEALFRVFRRVVSPNPDEVTIPRPVELHFASVPEPLFRIGSPRPAGMIDLRDEYALGKQQEGTLSFTGMYRSPRAIDESVAEQVRVQPVTPGGSRKRDHAQNFAEFAAAYRYFNEYKPSYSKATALSRSREKGGPTIGVLGDWFYYPRNFPCRLGLEGSLYVQRPEAGMFGTKGGPTEYSARFAASVAQHCELTPKAYHVPSLSVFQRIMSMRKNDRYAVAALDQDVFTSYKAEHRFGVVATDYVAFEPWLDTHWFVRGSVTTNESICPHVIDNLGFHVGWKQLLGPLQADLIYRYSHYFEDSDRPNPQDRNFLELGLKFDTWTVRQHRFQLEFRAERDLDQAEYSGFLSLSWFMGEGRGLRDFRPGDGDFKRARELRIPQVRNNRVVSVHGTPNHSVARR